MDGKYGGVNIYHSMMARIDDFINPGYIPSYEDILRVRVRTTGIVEISFKADEINFK